MLQGCNKSANGYQPVVWGEANSEVEFHYYHRNQRYWALLGIGYGVVQYLKQLQKIVNKNFGVVYSVLTLDTVSAICLQFF